MIDLSTSQLSLSFEPRPGGLALQHFGAGNFSWLHPSSTSGLFAVHIDGQRYDAAALQFAGSAEEDAPQAVRHTRVTFEGPGFAVDQHILTYEATALAEMWPVIRCTGDQALRVGRVDSFSLDLPAAGYQLLYYTSEWGDEFNLQQAALTGEVLLETRAGRSSKGMHPWFALVRDGEALFSASVVWSGNWALRFSPLPEGGFRAGGGMHDWEFSKDLAPGDGLTCPPVVLVLGETLNEIAQQYASVGRKHWYPHSALAERLPVEWNHWWPYEDVDIDAGVFRDNVARAAEMGIEVCTLDAGWFGPSDPSARWYEHRGDWHLVNQQRFPDGIRPLADDAHARGMAFGIWCEVEALGIKAQLAEIQPTFPAKRDGERLGYVCFGNPDVQEWAYQTLRRLITEYDANWIKLDFNLDPGAGCNRVDHGHQAGDGLYEHYQGYYRTLERVRRDFPNVVLENCSSGGLRIDLGMLRQTHMTFLSDPDWPVHDLQIFWGASTMLAPEVLLHWGFSDWRSENPPPQQTFNPHDPNLTQARLDYYTRMSMLGLYGFSQKLPDLPGWVAQRMTELTRIYKEKVRRFVKEGDLYRLTYQPRRDGAGERWTAFQYSLPDRSEHLLFVFRLPRAEASRAIQLRGLQPDRSYSVAGLEDEFEHQTTGQALMDAGLVFDTLAEEESALYIIR